MRTLSAPAKLFMWAKPTFYRTAKRHILDISMLTIQTILYYFILFYIILFYILYYLIWFYNILYLITFCSIIQNQRQISRNQYWMEHGFETLSWSFSIDNFFIFNWNQCLWMENIRSQSCFNIWTWSKRSFIRTTYNRNQCFFRCFVVSIFIGLFVCRRFTNQTCVFSTSSHHHYDTFLY